MPTPLFRRGSRGGCLCQDPENPENPENVDTPIVSTSLIVSSLLSLPCCGFLEAYFFIISEPGTENSARALDHCEDEVPTWDALFGVPILLAPQAAHAAQPGPAH